MTEKRVMLFYPPGRMFMRGEDRCQANISGSTAAAMRACNDLGYAAAILRKKGCEVFLRDYQTEEADMSAVMADVMRFKPDMLVLSTTSATVFEDISVMDEIRGQHPCITALKGAIFFSPPAELSRCADFSQIDYLIGGELDYVISPLVDCALFGTLSPDKVPSILYKSDDSLVPSFFDTQITDLDSIPFPARDLMNNALYVRPDTGEPMATIQTSRGCPSRCIYCLSPVISGKCVRFRSPENILAELIECYEKYGIRSFFFKSDTFTIDGKWTRAVCRKIIDSPLWGKIEFTANSRVHPLDKSTLAMMKKAGCFMAAFGIETGSKDTLMRIKKGTTFEQARLARQWARELKLPFYAFFMIGFPWEDMSHLRDTERFIFELNPDFIEISVALPFYGTELYGICKSEGLISGEILGKDYFSSVSIGTKYLSDDELMRFRNRVLLKFHLRPTFIAKKLVCAASNPKVIASYFKYGMRMLRNIFC